MQFDRLSYQVIDFLCRGDIGSDGCGRTTQVARRLLKFFGRACSDDEKGTSIGKCPGRCKSDSLRGAGDDRHLSRK
jgi:hypothetical protein